MTEQLKPGWRWENFDYLRSTVVTAPNGMEYELRAGDIAHPRAQRLFDAMFAALTQRPAAQTEREAFEARVVAEAGEGAIAKWLGTDGYENTRVQDNRLGWVWCLEWQARASLPAPQQATPDVPETDFGNMATQQAAGEPVGEPAGYTFVQPVPEQCDRIIWRGQYIHLPITHPAPGVPEGFALVPIKSDDAILRPFYNCPPEELGLAWDAAMRVAQVRLAAAQANGADPEDLAAAGVMLMGRRADHD